MKFRYKGFSLIEVMIVVAIIGILSSIAYPSYVDYVTRAARADALAALVEVANLEEQYYLDHRVYTQDMALLGLPSPFIVENRLYNITVLPADNNTTYTITATPLGVQLSRDTDCKTITLSSTGVKGSTNSDTDDSDGGDSCWK